ncbi:F0F1 ATP synthase subunit gamma [Candidatus Daviesbacteria bacterium]|nr:F0F1 ATP synthase subunit gamma [Candidatus Daviesbacteria bacterium]
MTIQQIDQIIQDGEVLKVLSDTFGEIALLKIRKIRAGVERNRSFFGEIIEVYRQVKKEASKRGIKLQKTKDTISILLASNYRFYGGITNRLLEFFTIYTTKTKTDRLIIGKTAIDQLKFMRYASSYSSRVFKTDMPTDAELLSLVEGVKGYKKILVFYPQLKSLLVQNPTVIDITQSHQNESQSAEGASITSFIFEPEIKKTLEFFDSQLTTLLLEQLFLESELARTGSRLISMDQAQVDANAYIKEKKRFKARIIRTLNNNRNIEQATSLAALKRERYS